MGEKQDELEQLETEFSEETKQLQELEEKLGVNNNMTTLLDCVH